MIQDEKDIKLFISKKVNLNVCASETMKKIIKFRLIQIEMRRYLSYCYTKRCFQGSGVIWTCQFNKREVTYNLYLQRAFYCVKNLNNCRLCQELTDMMNPKTLRAQFQKTNYLHNLKSSTTFYNKRVLRDDTHSMFFGHHRI